jgi:type II secretory pathway predicted ATPase ExeA
MFKPFYSLSKTPFSKDISPNEVFPSASHAEALARLDFLRKTKGIGLFTGEAGAGKTLTLRSFVATLNPSLFKPIYLPLASLTVMDTYRSIAMALGVNATFRKIDLFHQIQHAVSDLSKTRGITPVFIFDEMQLSRDAFLSDIALLFNFSMDSDNPYILILAGLTHLNAKLYLAQHRPLNQRILTRYNFEPLSSEETFAYVKHHLSYAGATHEIFSEAAIRAIYSLSSGWPRVINQLANHALISGYQFKKNVVDEDCVRAAAIEAGL